MKRTTIQRAITPRNYAFGRIAFCSNNLKNLLFGGVVLTNEEREIIDGVVKALRKMYYRKKINNEIIKKLMKVEKIMDEINKLKQ
tara:strand:+ start:533 stop:787 length:255 start_codon:yes stop_codon:yes gene_type:complete